MVTRARRRSLSVPRWLGILLLAAGGSGCGPGDPAGPAIPGGETPGDAGKAAPRYSGNWVSTPRLFASGTRIASLAATPSRLLAATLGEAPAKLVAFTESGTPVPFAPGFTAPPEARCHVDVAPGVGEFTPGDVFVGSGADVWQLAQDGAAALVLAALPVEDGPITGLCFDTAGSFGFDLLALTASGAVHRVDAAGRTRLAGQVGTGGSGPSVAAARFGRLAGRLLVAFPLESVVRALDSGGNVEETQRWSGVSGAYAAPDDPRAYGTSEGALFVATASGELYRYPLGDLAGRGGELLLTTIHSSGSSIVAPEGGGYRWRPFSRFVGAEVAAAFVRRPAVVPVVIEVLPGAVNKVITVGSTALVPVGILAATGFDPAILNGGDVRLAGAQPVSRSRTRLGIATDLDGDGVLDLLLQFRPADMQLPLGQATLVLDGTALAGDRVRGAARVLVLAP